MGDVGGEDGGIEKRVGYTIDATVKRDCLFIYSSRGFLKREVVMLYNAGASRRLSMTSLG